MRTVQTQKSTGNFYVFGVTSNKKQSPMYSILILYVQYEIHQIPHKTSVWGLEKGSAQGFYEFTSEIYQPRPKDIMPTVNGQASQ